MRQTSSLRLRRLINTPARKIGDKSVETAMQLAVEYGTTLYDVVCHASQYPALSRGAAAMEKFGEMIENLNLSYNRARQAAITQEITEIVAGSGEVGA